MNYGTLRIITPDGQVREYPLETPAVGIGRSSENAIVIEHISVDPRHARVTIDSGNAFIEDLGSEGGTYLGGRKVDPGERHLLSEGALRLGDVDLVFFAPEVMTGTLPGGARPAVAASPPPAQVLSVKLLGPDGPIAPGGTTTATLEVQNRGTTVDEVRIAVHDLPPGWATVSRPLVALLPNARDEVTITLQPPKTMDAEAGDHSFAVSAASSVHGNEVRVLGVLSIGSFEGFTVVLHPLRADRNFKVTIENTGNAPAALALTGQDDEGSLSFEFDTLNVDLDPGEQRAVSLRVKMAGAPKFGAEIVKNFRVEAAPSRGDGAPSTANGQLRVKPPLQAWKFPVAGLLVVGALAGGGLGYAAKCESWELPGCEAKDATAGAGGDSTTGQLPTAEGKATIPATAVGTTPTTRTPTPAGGGTVTPTVTVVKPATIVPGSLTFPKAETVLDPKKDYLAIVSTTAGDFTIDLEVAKAFNTSNSFAFLALKGFYDGLPFKQLTGSVQHGDPKGDGTGNAGYLQAIETSGLTNKRGAVGMIPDTRARQIGSQWFVNLQDNTFFDRGGITGLSRPVFGTVVKGLDVLEDLTDKDVVRKIAIQEK